MTHEYTLLVGATVLPGGDAPACEALAWAAGTILALGSEADVRAMSRGDSHVMALPGRFIVPLDGVLEVGAAADLAVLDRDPRLADGGGPATIVAVVRGGHVVDAGPEVPAGA